MVWSGEACSVADSRVDAENFLIGDYPDAVGLRVRAFGQRRSSARKALSDPQLTRYVLTDSVPFLQGFFTRSSAGFGLEHANADAGAEAGGLVTTPCPTLPAARSRFLSTYVHLSRSIGCFLALPTTSGDCHRLQQDGPKRCSMKPTKGLRVDQSRQTLMHINCRRGWTGAQVRTRSTSMCFWAGPDPLQALSVDTSCCNSWLEDNIQLRSVSLTSRSPIGRTCFSPCNQASAVYGPSVALGASDHNLPERPPHLASLQRRRHNLLGLWFSSCTWKRTILVLLHFSTSCITLFVKRRGS
jgi:hypothetical protein